MPRSRALCLVALAVVAGVAAAATPGLEPVLRETFESFPAGPFPAKRPGWTLLQESKTQALVAPGPQGGKALRIVDNHSARSDASCRIRQVFGPVQGRCIVEFSMMLRRGDADAVRQDMGVNLLSGGAYVLNVFFSGGEIKTWQGKTWASLDPPVPWVDGQWYHLALDIDLRTDAVAVTVDGVPRKPVRVRTRAAFVNTVDLTSQRSAQGELWVDDLRIDRVLPPELRAEPSAAWTRASDAQRRGGWFPDQGTTVRDGWLSPMADGLASMRTLVAVAMDEWPLLCLDVSGQGSPTYTVYAKPIAGHAVAIEDRASDLGRREHDLFALAAWQGRQSIELLCSVRGAGRIRVGKPTIATSPPNAYLSNSAAVWRFVAPSAKPNILPERIPLTISGEPGLRHVTQGVPFPKGMLSRPGELALVDAKDVALPLQTQVLSAWSDGSVRWLLVDTQATLPAAGRRGASLVGRAARPALPHVATQQGAKITLNTGAFTWHVSRPMGNAEEEVGWDLLIRADGVAYRASKGVCRATIQTNGPLRATVLVCGTLSDGAAAPFTYELRLTAFRGFNHIHIAPTFTLLGDKRQVQLEEVSLILHAHFPAGDVVVGADKPVTGHRPAGATVRLTQDTIKHCTVTVDGKEVSAGQRAAGWMSAGPHTVAVRRFWQQFAKGLALSDHELRVELWSPAGGPRRFGQGAAKTHEVLLASHPNGLNAAAAARAARAFERPATLHPGPEWYRTSRALCPFTLREGRFREMDGIYRQALERRFYDQGRRSSTSFGMVHYGDIGHINSEIDAAKSFFIEWARTGERRWLDFGLDWALHSQDLDVCLHSPNPRQIGIHYSHHSRDHNDDGFTLTHTWIEGQLYRYYLTGDRRSLLAADLAGRAFARSMGRPGQMFDAARPGAGIGSRGYGRACWALCELYRATGNPRYTWAMKRLTGYLTANLRDDGAVPAGHDGAGRWSTHDECPHMAAICAVGLARYMELTGDATRLPALERIARWQMSRGCMPEKLGVMYHNYAGAETLHFVDACADMLEAWAWLYDRTGNRLYRDFAETVYDTMVEMNERWRNDWTLGVRSVLFYLARRERWPAEPPGPAPETGSAAAADWLRLCQAEDGGFRNAPGLPTDMDATFRAVDALRLLGQRPARPDACVRWIESCRNPDGGYSGEPQWHSNIAWTWSALSALAALDAAPPAATKTAAWLNSAMNDDGGAGSSPLGARRGYVPAWKSTCEYTAYKAQALRLLRGQVLDRERVTAFLQSLQTEAGGFKHRGGPACTGYTMDALAGLAALDAAPRDPDQCARWLSGLRRPDAGYGWPGGDRSTLRNTAHCLIALSCLGRLPSAAEREATARYVLSCQHPNGGFGHRPGHTPTVTATWYALRALAACAGRAGP